MKGILESNKLGEWSIQNDLCISVADSDSTLLRIKQNGTGSTDDCNLFFVTIYHLKSPLILESSREWALLWARCEHRLSKYSHANMKPWIHTCIFICKDKKKIIVKVLVNDSVVLAE